ncbi:MAG: HD domain-containing protein [Planctomycetes bacterium]|nr:HD domain-containing protein [Planctomycetota bacterium]
MTPVAEQTRPLTQAPPDARGWLGRLRARLNHAPGDMPAIEEALDGLSASLDQVLTDCAGMTEELLFVYEQLGVVFEVSRQLPTVENESTVLDLFVESLQRSFQGRTVGLARRSSAGRWTDGPRGRLYPPWLVSLLEQARENTAVMVQSAPPDDAPATPVIGGTPGESSATEFVREAMVGPVLAGESFVGAIVLTRGEGAATFRACDMGLLQSLTTFCGDLIRNHRLVRELREMSVAMVRSLVNAVDQKDEYTSGHSLRVAYYATLLGRELKLGDRDLQMLQWSGLLHDVGKIGIRDDVLKKEGRLTGEEFDHMKEHPVRSHSVVQAVPQLAEALDGVLHHHERYDGTGYPGGLKGESIPLQARIIQIADVFDALTSNRSYRAAYTWTKALSIMREEAGRTIDPQLGETFDALIHRILDRGGDAWQQLVAQADRFSELSVRGDETMGE